MLRRLSCLLPLLVLLIACEIPFSLEESAPPKLFVQCVPADGATWVRVRYAAPVGGQAPAAFRPSAVRLRVNGTVRELSETADGFLRCAAPLQAGDAVSLEVAAEGLPTAFGTTTVPPCPRICEAVVRQVDSDDGPVPCISIRLDAPPAEHAFFGLQILRRQVAAYLENGILCTEYRDSYTVPGRLLKEADILTADMGDYVQVDYADGGLEGWGEHPMTLLEASHFEEGIYRFYLDSFDVSLLAGLSGDGRQPVPEDFHFPDMEAGDMSGGRTYLGVTEMYRVRLYRLSPEFYYYAKALYGSQFDFLSNMGLIPPNFTYSNVKDGLGVVGALAGTETDFLWVEDL
ncbi:MAG: DUF4249 domain-containing protein [Bacteroidales bacterium]|nr:DUF4249 domain-containing protein [Bacteroidales bacterium]